MRLDDALTDRKPQTRARTAFTRTDLPETIEDVIEIFFFDPGSIVG